ncbi:MAG TPA: hypothetical protein VGD56_09610 [Gemmatirosa sp.]
MIAGLPGERSPSLDVLRRQLDASLVDGLADDALAHAEQVATVASVLYQAFRLAGPDCVLTGGSALEGHVPGVYKSADVDVVIGGALGESLRSRVVPVFETLGFAARGRHWTRGDLFVEVPSHAVDGPTELLHARGLPLRIMRIEALLKFRLVGFKYWETTSYAQQAIDVLAALDGDYDEPLLRSLLRAEGAEDAYDALLPLV